MYMIGSFQGRRTCHYDLAFDTAMGIHLRRTESEFIVLGLIKYRVKSCIVLHDKIEEPGQKSK